MSRFGLDDKRYSTISRYVIATALVLAVVANVGVYLPQIQIGRASCRERV